MKPEHLAAIRRQRPDSIAPDGAPLMFIPVADLVRPMFPLRGAKTWQHTIVDRTPCARCGTRADVGCAHKQLEA